MYGKLFATAYTGSMFGAGSHVFAVWGYILANKDADQLVELNPHLLAAVFGESVERVTAAIEYLSAPDERSRSEGENGRRIVSAGQSMMYFVVNGKKYDEIRNTDERRRQNREAQQRFRDTHAHKPIVSRRKQRVSMGKRESAPSAPVAVAVSVPTTAPVKTLPGVGAPAAPRKRGARVGDYSPVFEMAWQAYPKRAGNSKADAWRQWRRRAAEGVAEEVMLAGTEGYAAHVGRGNTDPRFIKMGATFYGPGRHFEADFGAVIWQPSEEDLLAKASPEQRRRIARIEQIVAEDAAEEARAAR